MQKLLISLCALVLSSIALASEEQQTVKVWVVDYKGKPPFKRSIKRVPVNEATQSETTTDTVPVKAKVGSKPPYKRRTVYLPVADVTQFKSGEDKPKPDFRGKPPFKR